MKLMVEIGGWTIVKLFLFSKNVSKQDLHFLRTWHDLKVSWIDNGENTNIEEKDFLELIFLSISAKSLKNFEGAI